MGISVSAPQTGLKKSKEAISRSRDQSLASQRQNRDDKNLPANNKNQRSDNQIKQISLTKSIKTADNDLNFKKPFLKNSSSKRFQNYNQFDPEILLNNQKQRERREFQRVPQKIKVNADKNITLDGYMNTNSRSEQQRIAKQSTINKTLSKLYFEEYRIEQQPSSKFSPIANNQQIQQKHRVKLQEYMKPRVEEQAQEKPAFREPEHVLDSQISVKPHQTANKISSQRQPILSDSKGLCDSPRQPESQRNDIRVTLQDIIDKSNEKGKQPSAKHINRSPTSNMSKQQHREKQFLDPIVFNDDQWGIPSEVLSRRQNRKLKNQPSYSIILSNKFAQGDLHMNENDEDNSPQTIKHNNRRQLMKQLIAGRRETMDEPFKYNLLCKGSSSTQNYTELRPINICPKQ